MCTEPAKKDPLVAVGLPTALRGFRSVVSLFECVFWLLYAARLFAGSRWDRVPSGPYEPKHGSCRSSPLSCGLSETPRRGKRRKPRPKLVPEKERLATERARARKFVSAARRVGRRRHRVRNLRYRQCGRARCVRLLFWKLQGKGWDPVRGTRVGQASHPGPVPGGEVTDIQGESVHSAKRLRRLA